MTQSSSIAIWALSAATIAAILLRPARISEWVWAAAGAALLVASGLLPFNLAGLAALDGLDVYLFLAGMLTLSELARITGVFDWLAGLLLPRAAGSGSRVFAGVYLAGVVVTALLSNDGTILLLTPAVIAVTRRAGLRPLPFLYACAFVANAASFVLPISNPANLVVFRHLPTVVPWMAAFALPSFAAVTCTYLVLRYAQRREVERSFLDRDGTPGLGLSGRAALITVFGSAALIVVAAGFGWPVGRVAFVLGTISLFVVALRDASTFRRVIGETHWSIIPLVAGLFVIIEALDRTGVLEFARSFFRHAAAMPAVQGNLLAGSVLTVADNVLNNLPAAVLVRHSLQNHGIGSHIVNAALVGIDLGPNLSLTGSLATLLWLMTLRRDGIEVTPGQFFRMGVLVTIPSLIIALICVR